MTLPGASERKCLSVHRQGGISFLGLERIMS
jgi:hypothetical protein